MSDSCFYKAIVEMNVKIITYPYQMSPRIHKCNVLESLATIIINTVI